MFAAAMALDLDSLYWPKFPRIGIFFLFLSEVIGLDLALSR